MDDSFVETNLDKTCTNLGGGWITGGRPAGVLGAPYDSRPAPRVLLEEFPVSCLALFAVRDRLDLPGRRRRIGPPSFGQERSMNLLARINERRRRRAERRLESAAARTIYSRSPEGRAARAADEQARRNAQTSAGGDFGGGDF
jgi:hypothetical protein